MRDPNILFPKVSPMHLESALQRTAGTYFSENDPEGIHYLRLHDPLFPLRNLSAGAEAFSLSTLKRNAPEMELPQCFDRIKKSGTGISDAALYSFTDN